MHQIFYIDIDEEITSVIDRLRKSSSTENFFVVSPRALILHSVVSLKLLKKEAESENKQIAIVINDSESKNKIEKAGILVVPSLKGLEGEEIKENFSVNMETEIDNKNKYNNDMGKINKKSRLQEIGSDDFYREEKGADEGAFLGGENFGNMRIGQKSYEREKKTPISRASNASPKNMMDVKKDLSFSYTLEKNFESAPSPVKTKEYASPFSLQSNSHPNFNQPGNNPELDPYKERLLEGFFSPEKKSNNYRQSSKTLPKPGNRIAPKSGGAKKIIFSLLAICFGLAVLAAAYLYVPGAKISVLIKSDVKKISLNVKGDIKETEIKSDPLTIPAKLIEKEDSLTVSFSATGSQSSASNSSQKAKGKVTIYNEFGKDSQQLVATTRLLSTDGKLFRLVKNVTIPGMTDSGPGSVEAEIIADQAGSEFNIGASSFKIPGFEGSSKYEKFYAKSTLAMSGGGQSSSSGITVISQDDLDKAKKEAEAKLKDQIMEKIKSEIGSEQILLEGASELTVSESSTSSRLNEVASNFEYQVKGKLKGIVFSENDLKKAAAENSKVDSSSLRLAYGNSMADFNAGTISIKANVETISASDTDWDEFKKELLGKDEEQIKEILKRYPQIEKINIDFWPNFMTQKIPQYENRITIEVQNSEE